MVSPLSISILTAVVAAEPARAISPDTLAGVLIALGVAIMAVLLIVSARSRMAGEAQRRSDQRDRSSHAVGVATQQHLELASSVRHLEQMREHIELLEQKSEQIEQLLAEADERIAMLRALNHSIAESKPMPTVEPADPLTRSVYELADSGRSPVEIARKLDEQVGKVDLILALRGR